LYFSAPRYLNTSRMWLTVPLLVMNGFALWAKLLAHNACEYSSMNDELGIEYLISLCVLNAMLCAVPSEYTGIAMYFLMFLCIYFETTGLVSCGNYHKTTLGSVVSAYLSYWSMITH